MLLLHFPLKPSQPLFDPDIQVRGQCDCNQYLKPFKMEKCPSKSEVRGRTKTQGYMLGLFVWNAGIGIAGMDSGYFI